MGSEMCIRDRNRKGNHHGNGKGNIHLQQEREKDHGLRCTEKTGNEETDRRKEEIHGTVEKRQKSGRLSGAVFHGQKVQKERKECSDRKETDHEADY